jgi:hypothetical protein
MVVWLLRINKNVTLLQSASSVATPGERNAVTGASQSVRRNHNNDTTKEVVEAVSR